MAKEYNWLEHEILGDINEIAPPLRPAPDLPVLDEPQALRKHSGNAADSTIAAIEFDSMVDQLCPIPIDAQLDRDVQRFSPPADLEAAGLHFVKHVMELGAERMQRKAEISKGSTRRQRELREITEHCLGTLLPRSDSDTVSRMNSMIDRIANSAERVCSDAILEATNMKPLFRNPYGATVQQDGSGDTDFWFEDQPDDQRDEPARQLQPVCWKCFAPLNLCRCSGGPQ